MLLPSVGIKTDMIRVAKFLENDKSEKRVLNMSAPGGELAYRVSGLATLTVATGYYLLI